VRLPTNRGRKLSWRPGGSVHILVAFSTENVFWEVERDGKILNFSDLDVRESPSKRGTTESVVAE
jgi:hypothetical protein